MFPSFCPLQVEVRADRLVPWHHIGPVLGMVIGINGREDGMMHVSVLRSTGHVDEVKFDRLSVRRFSSDHPWTIARVAIVNQREVITIQVEHGDRMVVL